MTHSTRKSYKEKWLAAKRDQDNRPLEKITEAATLINEANEYRIKETDLVKELAAEAVTLLEMMDHPDGKGTLVDEKDYRKPIDSNLVNFDNLLILRRSRDIMKRATDRIGMLGLASKDSAAVVRDYESIATTLVKPADKISRGIFSSYVVGTNPTVPEMEKALEMNGKNPRMIDFVYYSDDSDSDTENENDSYAEDSIDTLISAGSALERKTSRVDDGTIPSASNAIVKPKSPARQKKKTSGDIVIT